MQDKWTAAKFPMSVLIFERRPFVENRHWVKNACTENPATDIGPYLYIDLYVYEAGIKGFGENNKEPSTETGFNPETDRPWSEK